MIRIPDSWHVPRSSSQQPFPSSFQQLPLREDLHQTAVSLKQFCYTNLPWRKRLHTQHAEPSSESSAAKKHRADESLRAIRVRNASTNDVSMEGMDLDGVKNVRTKQLPMESTGTTTGVKANARSNSTSTERTSSTILHFPRLSGSLSSSSPLMPAAFRQEASFTTHRGTPHSSGRPHGKALIAEESDDDGNNCSQGSSSRKMLSKGRARTQSTEGCLPRSKSPARRRGRGALVGDDEDCSTGEKQFSLFGIGLLTRLEKQATTRRRRMNSKRAAPDSNVLDKPGSASSAKGQGDAGSSTTTASSVFPDPGDIPLQQKRRNSVKYAFDQENIYNFAETRSAHCFPRQSAQEACQAIIDSIHKCSAHEALQACAAAPGDGMSPEQQQQQPRVPGSIIDSSCLEVNLDHILSCVPYKDMLQGLFEHSTQAPSAAQDRGPLACSYEGEGEEQRTNCLEIPIVAKSYEESFMREPMWDYERPCMMGPNCECHFISTAPGESFTGVEFLLPSESVMDCSTRSERRMCVLCHRKLVQSLFYDIIYSGAPYRGVIQRYGNICNHAGEYAREVMLICPPNGPVECMPFPLVSHQRNKYSVYTKGGIRYIKQNRLSWEDFCQAPPSSAVP